MATAFWKALNERLTKLAKVDKYDRPIDWLYDQIADGQSVKKIAVRAQCSRSFLYTSWMKKVDPEWEKNYASALRESGSARAERGEEILENVRGTGIGGSLTTVDVQLATSQAKYQQWLASIHDSKFADKPSVQINLTTGDLHIDALRVRAPKSVVAKPVNPKQLDSGEAHHEIEG